MIEPVRLSFRTWPALAALLSATVLTAGCAAPDHALVASCETEMLALGNPRTCKVRAARLPEYRSVSFEIDSYQSTASVSAQLELATGEVRVSLAQVKDSSWTLRAGQPLTFKASVPIGSNNLFSLVVEPVGGEAAGLSGTLDYKTP